MRSPRDGNNRAGMRGMTLVELLSAMTIAGIVASIGYAGYSSHIERLRLRQAVSGIERIQLAIAQYATRPDRLADGLPDELQELGIDPAWLTDPWGRRYQYQKRARLNRDYDLYSLGRDGVTGPRLDDAFAADDVVRGANGAFVGTSAEFAAIAGTDTAQFVASADGQAAPGGDAADGGSLLIR